MMLTAMTLDLWNKKHGAGGVSQAHRRKKEEGMSTLEDYFGFCVFQCWTKRLEENLLWRLHLSQLNLVPCARLQQTEFTPAAYIDRWFTSISRGG